MITKHLHTIVHRNNNYLSYKYILLDTANTGYLFLIRSQVRGHCRVSCIDD